VSYDISVWFEPEPITVEVASRKLMAFFDHDDSSGFMPSARMLGFYAELMERYPPLEGMSDVDLEEAVWSVTPEESDRVMTFNLTWPKAAEFGSVVRQLAGEHGLVSFDAYEELTHPPAITHANRLKLSTERGSLVFDPDLSSIREMLAGLDNRNWFAILDRPDGWYIQVGRVKGESQWALEYREGTADRHFRTEVPTLDGLAEVFYRFTTGDYGWQGSHTWQRLDFD
jgi:hypothetical protein